MQVNINDLYEYDYLVAHNAWWMHKITTGASKEKFSQIRESKKGKQG